MVKATEITTDFAHPDFDIDAWVQSIAADRPAVERELIQRAAHLAAHAHRGQKRKSGEPYIAHVFAVTEILNRLNLDYETLCAAILHDVVEDTDVTLEQIRTEYGMTIAKLVDGVTKMALISDYPAVASTAKIESRQAENLRKLLLAMVEDVRVVLIKLADRVHNMRTLSHLPREKQVRIAQETLDIFAPLANRLGIWQIKWELEDLSLRYVEPEQYKKIARLLDERRVDREKYIAKVIDIIKAELKKAGIEAEVYGRPKHIYSIWKKMKRKGIGFHEVFDVRAVRILVDTVTHCYAALGIVHSLWKHIPKEFDDYIATPKENDYQSLHTAVVGPESKTLEIQIRTYEMHEHSELGVAAHWRYKEGGRYDAKYEDKIAWLRQLLDWKDEGVEAGDFIDRFKSEVFQDRVYVLTPKGNVIDLRAGATPLDFAYAIHTDIGQRCRGAKVDGRIVPLTYDLKNGEQVEILTTRHGTPSRDWLSPHLGYLKTPRARAKVRAWFKQLDQGKNIADGKAIVERELARVGLNQVDLQKLAEKFHAQTVNEFLAHVGRGEITSTQVVSRAQEFSTPENHDTQVLRKARPAPSKDTSGDIKILGVGNLLTHIAKCCKPVPSDPIVGYITKGRGVTIHRQDCPNILRIQEDSLDRLIEVSWSEGHSASYPVDIAIVAYDRQGLLRDISSILSNEKLNVLSINTMTDLKDHMARMHITLEISDIAQLSRVLAKINQLPNVLEAQRKQ